MMKIINVLGLIFALSSVSILPTNAKQILDGHYSTGPTNGTREVNLEVKSQKYREYDEGWYSPWKSTSALTFVKKGTIRLPNPYSTSYLCLNSMKGIENLRLFFYTCTEKGWTKNTLRASNDYKRFSKNNH